MSDPKGKHIADLVARYGASLENLLARRLDNADVAAELAQVTFLCLHRLEQPQTLDNARAYLFQIANNLALDQLGRRKLQFRFLKSEQRELMARELPDANAEAMSPEQVLRAKEKLKAMQVALNELPLSRESL